MKNRACICMFGGNSGLVILIMCKSTGKIMRWFTRNRKCGILKDNARMIKEQINEVVKCHCSLL